MESFNFVYAGNQLRQVLKWVISLKELIAENKPVILHWHPSSAIAEFRSCLFSGELPCVSKTRSTTRIELMGWTTVSQWQT
jgi:hypothetical protein